MTAVFCNFIQGDVIIKSLILTITPQRSITLPYAHTEMLQGLFYRLLSYNNEVSTCVHDRQIENHSVYKLFCFSDLQGKYNVIDKGIEFYGELTWEIRSVDDKIIETVLETLFRHRDFALNNCPFTVTDLRFSDVYFDNGKISFEMKTPIVAYITDDNGKTIYYSPSDCEFYDIIEQNLRNKYLLIFGNDYFGEFELECKYCPEKYKRVTKYKSTIINAWLGKFVLSAQSEMLFVAYYCGIGSKNSMGLGMINLM